MKIKTVHVFALALIVIAVFIVSLFIGPYITSYLTVSQVTETNEYVGKPVKIWGTLANVSTGWSEGGLHFNLTDDKATIKVTYTGSLSQSLKEGQEIGVIGVLNTPYHVNATELVIKCASKYE